jgi:hypothetical protein
MRWSALRFDPTFMIESTPVPHPLKVVCSATSTSGKAVHSLAGQWQQIHWQQIIDALDELIARSRVIFFLFEVSPIAEADEAWTLSPSPRGSAIGRCASEESARAC